jgi:hypothetical protein
MYVMESPLFQGFLLADAVATKGVVLPEHMMCKEDTASIFDPKMRGGTLAIEPEYNSPNTLRVLEEFDRLEAITMNTPVISVLGFVTNSEVTLAQCKKAYYGLSQQIHPDKGGNCNPTRGVQCSQIIARARVRMF